MNDWKRVASAVLVMVVCVGAGCQPRAPLPTHEWDDFREALRVIEQRNAAIENVSSAFDLTIRRPEGGTVTLEGAMVAERPDRMRLQAWRFHREVMDLVRSPEGTWLWTAEQVDEIDEQFAHPQAHEVDWFQAFFMTPDPETSQLIEAGGGGEPMVVRWPLGGGDGETGGWHGRAEIDGATLTVMRIDVYDETDTFVQRVLFSEYRVMDGLVFPMRIGAEGQWNATLRSHDVELNGDLPTGVFEPPARANRLD
ncbi:hypothetical protein ACERK3_05150 [Phycisphaerales bacterium AB-hyl4]|uniref:Outer membrane lipoprotein-sorting protein n=1 Tax=Natronomicrosphaera hydrolytica TaxID=3242702 RepID=A0ABV4U445_9BACT